MKVYGRKSWWCESFMSYDELNFSSFCPMLLKVIGKDLGQTLPCILMIFPALSIGKSVFIEIATETIVYRERFTYFNVFQRLKPDKTH